MARTKKTARMLAGEVSYDSERVNDNTEGEIGDSGERSGGQPAGDTQNDLGPSDLTRAKKEGSVADEDECSVVDDGVHNDGLEDDAGMNEEEEDEETEKQDSHEDPPLQVYEDESREEGEEDDGPPEIFHEVEDGEDDAPEEVVAQLEELPEVQQGENAREGYTLRRLVAGDSAPLAVHVDEANEPTMMAVGAEEDAEAGVASDDSGEPSESINFPVPGLGDGGGLLGKPVDGGNAGEVVDVQVLRLEDGDRLLSASADSGNAPPVGQIVIDVDQEGDAGQIEVVSNHSAITRFHIRDQVSQLCAPRPAGVNMEN